MSFATVNGVRLHHHTSGGRGSGLVLMHGYGGSLDGWRHQVDAFSGVHRILALDHWAHGESEAPATAAGYDVERVAEDLRELATLAGFARFHLVGHSLGGAVAQEVALRSPDRLLSLTLADTTDWFGDHDELDEDGRERSARSRSRVEAATWNALLRWPGSRDRAAAIRRPTLILHGARDAPKILEGSQRLAHAIPGAELVVIPDAGHGPHVEQPDRFNAVLGAFLAAVERGDRGA